MAHMIDIIKYEGDNSTFVWKHPKEDFNTNSQLIVHESQEAIFFANGQALDLFGPGRYSLETQNMPMLSKYFNKLSKGETAFHCEVYFINKTVQMSIPWGTPELIRFIEPTLNIPLCLGASGKMNLAVSDSRKLILKLVGTMSGADWHHLDEREDKEDVRRAGGNNVELEAKKAKRFTQSLQKSFLPLITSALKKHIPAVIKENKIDLLEIDSNLELFSEALRKPINEGFEEYGLTMPQFYVLTVNLPENDPNFRKFRELHSLTLEKRVMEAETEIIAKRAEEAAAQRVAKIDAETSVLTRESEAKAQRQTAEAKAATQIAEAKAETKMKEAEIEAKLTAAQREAILEGETTATEMEKRKLEREILAAKAQAEKELVIAQAEAQAQAQKTKLTGLAEAEVMQAKGLAEAEEMRAKGVAQGEGMRAQGYTQKDVLQADVQKSYADALGNISLGDNIGGDVTISGGASGGGLGVNGMVGDMVKLGLGMAVAGKVSQPMHDMINNFEVPGLNPNQAQASIACPSCGASVGANAKFCPECGTKIERLAENEIICPSCGQKTAKGKFCQECGTPLIRKCTGCGAELAGGAKFCPECGAKQ